MKEPSVRGVFVVAPQGAMSRADRNATKRLAIPFAAFAAPTDDGAPTGYV